jgi:ankyrin repeat protein
MFNKYLFFLYLQLCLFFTNYCYAQNIIIDKQNLVAIGAFSSSKMAAVFPLLPIRSMMLNTWNAFCGSIFPSVKELKEVAKVVQQTKKQEEQIQNEKEKREGMLRKLPKKEIIKKSTTDTMSAIQQIDSNNEDEEKITAENAEEIKQKIKKIEEELKRYYADNNEEKIIVLKEQLKALIEKLKLIGVEYISSVDILLQASDSRRLTNDINNNQYLASQIDNSKSVAVPGDITVFGNSNSKSSGTNNDQAVSRQRSASDIISDNKQTISTVVSYHRAKKGLSGLIFPELINRGGDGPTFSEFSEIFDNGIFFLQRYSHLDIPDNTWVNWVVEKMISLVKDGDLDEDDVLVHPITQEKTTLGQEIDKFISILQLAAECKEGDLEVPTANVLCIAACTGSISAVKYFLRKENKKSTLDDALLLAVNRGNTEVVRLLLAVDSNLKVDSALMVAIAHEDIGLVKVLSMHLKTFDAYKILRDGCYKGGSGCGIINDMVGFYHNHKADNTLTALAVRSGNFQVVRALLSGVLEGINFTLDMKKKYMSDIIFCAHWFKQYQIACELLCIKEFFPYIDSRLLNLLLFKYAYNSNAPISLWRVILGKGIVNPDTEVMSYHDNKKITALAAAIARRNAEVVDMLLEFGANLRAAIRSIGEAKLTYFNRGHDEREYIIMTKMLIHAIELKDIGMLKELLNTMKVGSDNVKYFKQTLQAALEKAIENDQCEMACLLFSKL